MRAVLWDMDGTLVDSEKLWDISLSALYESLGGSMSRETRTALVGASADETMATVYAELGLELDPRAMADSIRWLHEHTAGLFDDGLPWCDGARDMLEALAADGTPMALVTNTQRALTERALNSIGRHYFSVTVCADEVPSGKPAPDPYLRAAHLLGLSASECLAVEDSVTGTAAAEKAGCAVLVVPNDVPVPGGIRRRHADSLAGLSADDLRRIYREIDRELRSA
ncbi:HAD family phosphatase [Mycolicibacterium rufum]|uniref:HAD family phosphatase n=1 Tax=Mycolicibacterium rufum TaxID=318424 RepID=A0A9X2YDQ8_9MYCO|nr:HAD family phosphatase [Mycolicibacterium rufum]KGI68669.1 HAD family hydrolase [Mycolicibacterium rufum]MCV7071450.1 HAD family phosphatase [Mycolicibacterium rufum]ULP34818.1 HAD family phosphatase [Mycolicibacterium rufum]